MNREILFRGKRETDGRWLYGLYSDARVYGTDFPCIMPLMNTPNDNDWAIIPSTVGQYTGLTDKNGKKIFEGDILSAYFDDEYPENETRVKVQWRDLAWHTCQSGCSPDRLEPFEDGVWTIIGTIYDSPELI